MRFCSTLLTSALVSLMLSGCLFIPVPIGVVYPSANQNPESSAMSREKAMAAPSTTSPSTPDGKLASKKGEHQENAKLRQEPVECKEQAEKLFSDADRRAYTKECISEER